MFLLNLIFYCTVLIKNINSTSVYRYLVDGYVDGPTEEGVSTIPVNHILLGDTSIDALDKFMLTGWFMINSEEATSKNLAFAITNSDDVQNQILLAVTINNNISYAMQCFSANLCITVNITGYQQLFVDDIWVFVMAGVDITNSRFHFKLLLHPNSLNIPQVYSRTINHRETQPWTNLRKVNIKNKLTNSHGLNRFCGQMTRVKWYAGFYLEDNTRSIDLNSDLLLQWIGLDSLPLLQAVNSINNFRNKGTYGTGYLVPDFDSTNNIGINYKQREAISYKTSKDIFQDHFTISFWFKAIMSTTSPMIGVFNRIDAYLNSRLQIKLVYQQDLEIPANSGIDVVVPINAVIGENHGNFNLTVNTYYRVTLVVFTHFNLIIPQAIFHLIVTPIASQYYIMSYMIYQDQLTDVFYIGDPGISKTWGSDGVVHLHDFRIYSGASFSIHEDANPYMGCHISVGAITTHCLQCKKQIAADTRSDPFRSCDQAFSLQTAGSTLATFTRCPWGTIYDYTAMPTCQPHNIVNCAIASSSTTCTLCVKPYTWDAVLSLCTLASTVTAADMMVEDFPFAPRQRLCQPGTLLCYLENGITKNIIECEPGTFLQETASTQTCPPCLLTCYKCINDHSCSQCFVGQFLTLDNQCVSDCEELFSDIVNNKCVLDCDPVTLFKIEDDTKMECVSQCPSPYNPFGKICSIDCPNQTYKSDGVCLPCSPKCKKCAGKYNIQCQQCNTGFFLEVLTPCYFPVESVTKCSNNKCDNFCEDPTLYKNEVLLTCSIGCPSPALYIEDEKRCVAVCPITPILYAEYQGNLCLSICPVTYYLKPITYQQYGAYLTKYQCQQCHPSCVICSDSNNNSCTKCSVGFYLTMLICKPTCYDPMYPYKDEVNLVCQRSCPSSVFQYENGMQCLSICPVGWFGYRQSCLDACPVGLYLFVEAQTCLKCSIQCETCFGNMVTQCLSCMPGYFLYDTTCYLICPYLKPYKNYVLKSCVASCPDDKVQIQATYECKDSCPLIYTLDADGKNCLTECPAGQFKNSNFNACQACNPACATCSGSDKNSCITCNPNFFLDVTSCDADVCATHPDYLRSQYYWLCTEQCIGRMLLDVDRRMCVPRCPVTLFRLTTTCYSTCPVGYYKNDVNMICSNCPTECLECFGRTANECTLCSPTYYSQGSSCIHYCGLDYYKNAYNWQCERVCSSNLLYDDDGSGNKNCLTNCPVSKFQFTGICLFYCPDGYFGMITSSQCRACSVECETCDGATNQDCLNCAASFSKTDYGCVGECKPGYYSTSNGCDLCSQKCQTCATNKFNCLQCRGDRTRNPTCICQKGQFDDGFSDLCQSCIAPCITCSSLSFCVTCPNNQNPPDCSCPRAPLIESDWCVSCTTAFPIIKFSDTLEQIIIDFGYHIQLKSFDAYLESYENCRTIFQADTLKALGNIPKCFLDQETQDKLIVNLDFGVSLNIGDALLFNGDSISDFSLINCMAVQIQNFITNIIIGPDNSPTPIINLQYPNMIISSCNGFTVQVEQEISGGKRDLIREPWEIIKREDLLNPDQTDQDTAYNQHIFNLQSIISVFNLNQSDFIHLPSSTIIQNSIYYITVPYKNFLGVPGTSEAIIKIGDESTPSVLVDKSVFGKYYAFENITIPIIVSAQSCSNGVVTLDENTKYNLNLQVVDMVSGASVYQITIPEVLERKINITIPSGSLKGGHDISLNISILDDNGLTYWHAKVIPIQETEIQAYFSTANRIIGGNISQILIDVEAYDPGISDPILRESGISFNWDCVDQFTQQKCRNFMEQQLKLNETRSQTIDRKNFKTNKTYIFYVQVTKGNVVKLINQQFIIVEEPTISELEFQPITDNKINENVKPYDMITLVFNPPREGTWAILTYDNYVKFIKYVPSTTLRFSVQEYETQFLGTKVMNLFFSGYKEFRTIKVEVPYNNYIVTVDPPRGLSLIDNFTISIKPKLETFETRGFTYDFYYYFNYTLMLNNKANYKTADGNAIAVNQSNNMIITELPAPNSKQQSLYLLFAVSTPQNLTTLYSYNHSVDGRSIQNQRQNVKKLLQYLDGIELLQTLEQLRKVTIAVTQLISRDQQACAIECEGKGTCIDQTGECMCDTDWYLSDCSGGKSDQWLVSSLTQKMSETFLRMIEDTEVLEDSFQTMNLVQSMSNLMRTKYFQNYFGQAQNSSSISLAFLTFLEVQVNRLVLESQEEALNLRTLVQQTQAQTNTGFVMVVNKPFISTLPKRLSTFVYIITSMFQQNSLQFLKQSSLSNALESSGDEGDLPLLTEEQIQAAADEEAKRLSEINLRLSQLWNQILDLQGQTIQSGDKAKIISTPTLKLVIKRDFWSVLQKDIKNIGVSPDMIGQPLTNKILDISEEEEEEGSGQGEDGEEGEEGQGDGEEGEEGEGYEGEEGEETTIQTNAGDRLLVSPVETSPTDPTVPTDPTSPTDPIDETDEGQNLASLTIQNDVIYDLSITSYVFNPYRLQNNFPYPMNAFPVYETSIKIVSTGLLFEGDLQIQYIFNISQADLDQRSGFRWLNSSILVQDDKQIEVLPDQLKTEENYICIWMNKVDGDWQLCDQYQKIVGRYASYIQCNCSKLAPVTALNDINYIYINKFSLFNIDLDRNNLYTAIEVITAIWITLTIITMWRDKRIYDAIMPQMSGFAKITIDQKKLAKADIKEEDITTLKKIDRKKLQMSFQPNFDKSMEEPQKSLFINDDLAQQMAMNIGNLQQRKKHLKSANAWAMDEEKVNDQENIDETERKDGQTQLKGSNRGLLSGKYIASRAPQYSEAITPNDIAVEETDIKEVPTRIDQRPDYKSKHTIRAFHRNHSVLSIFFKFYKDIGRGFRLTYYYTRLIWMFCLSGILCQNDSNLAVNIVSQLIMSLALRIGAIPLKKSMVASSASNDPRCCYKFGVYFITSTLMLVAFIILLIFFYSLPGSCNEMIFFSWLFSIIIDFTFLEVAIDVALKGYEYYKWKKADEEEDFDYGDEDEEENQPNSGNTNKDL